MFPAYSGLLKDAPESKTVQIKETTTTVTEEWMCSKSFRPELAVKQQSETSEDEQEEKKKKKEKKKKEKRKKKKKKKRVSSDSSEAESETIQKTSQMIKSKKLKLKLI